MMLTVMALTMTVMLKVMKVIKLKLIHVGKGFVSILLHLVV